MKYTINVTFELNSQRAADDLAKELQTLLQPGRTLNEHLCLCLALPQITVVRICTLYSDEASSTES